MKVRIRHEINIEVEGDKEKAQKAKAYYKRLNYQVFNENKLFIQLDRSEEVVVDNVDWDYVPVIPSAFRVGEP